MARKSIGAFAPLTAQQSENFLAAHLPKGRLFGRKYDTSSNLYNLLYCVADFIFQICQQFYQIVYNMNIALVDILLTDWETAVGIPAITARIPQGSMTNAQWITARQNAVLQLISKIPVVNVNNTQYQKQSNYNIKTTYENYIYNLSGINILITFPSDIGNQFPMPFPIVFGLPYNQLPSLFIINVHVGYTAFTNTFPMTFPVLFAALGNNTLPVAQSTQNILNPILNNILPSFVTYSYNAII